MNSRLLKLTCFLFMVTISWQYAKAADYTPAEAFEYTIVNNQVTITNFIGNQTEVSIPPTIEDKPVVAIGDSAFYNHDKLSSVIIPNGVMTIGDYAFGYCNLTSVTLPSSVLSIGNGAFSNCTKLTEITIPNSVTSIGDYPFYGCSGLLSVEVEDGNESYVSVDGVLIDKVTKTLVQYPVGNKQTSYVIPEGVTSIGDDAFDGCTTLMSVVIPNGVISIGNYAFFGCTGLTSMTIPSSVTSIGDSPFGNCSNLLSIEVEEGSHYSTCYVSIDGVLFQKYSYHESVDGVWIESTKLVRLVQYPTGKKQASYDIPEGVTSIGIKAFYGCTDLMSVTIPASITSISEYAFAGCTSLTSVTIPDSVTYIGFYAFWMCSSLVSVTIPDNVTVIRGNAFQNCTSLTSVTIPNSVKRIPDRAFAYCTGLTSVTIPDSVTSIGPSAFWGCTSLMSVTIPEGVTSIEESTFYGCSNLTSVTIPEGVTSIGFRAFRGCTSLMSVTIPDGVTSIEEYTFYGCSNLTSVTIPDSVTSIGNYAFRGCTSLTSMTIPNSVTSIGNYAFLGCTSLTSMTIPNSVTSIGNYAFRDCTGLTSVTISDGVMSIGNGVFYGCMGLTSITIPDSITTIGNYAFRNCTSLTSGTIPSGVTSIGNGVFYGCTGLTSVTIPDSLISISNHTFWGCTGLTSVMIPDNVTSIGESAFSHCSGLTSVTIPANVTSISDYAFYECTSLESMFISNSVTSIGNYAFLDCSNLSEFVFDGGVVTFGEDCYPTPITFYVPANMGWEEWEVPDGVTLVITPESDYTYTIDDGKVTITGYKGTATDIRIPSRIEGKPVVAIECMAFFRHVELMSVTIPPSVTTIEECAFLYCDSLVSVTIPSSVTFIGDSAFVGSSLVSIDVDSANSCYTSVDGVLFNKSMTTLVQYPAGNSRTQYSITAGVTAIENDAFSWCDYLTSVMIPSSVSTIGEYAFYNCSNLASLTIPSSVTAIGEGAFSGCISLTSISIPSGLSVIEDHVFAHCWSLTSITIPSGVTSIGNSAFEYCESLTSITIPSSVTAIGEYAFFECWSLTSITIPSGVPSIGNRAFEYSESLTSITIPSSVTTIGECAFDGCSELTVLEFEGAPPTFGNNSYPTPITFNVPANMGWEEWEVPDGVTLEYLPDAQTQTIQLTAGWNWVGFTTLPENRKIGNVLGTAGFSVNDIIQTNGGAARFTGTSWMPGSFSVEYGKLYQIYVANDVEVVVGGEADGPLTVPLVAGWNWIANSTLEDLEPLQLTHSGGWSAGDRIQTSGGVSVIYTGNKWIPAGFTLESGKGYQIYTVNEGTLSFGEPENAALYAVVDLSGGADATNYPVRYTNTAPNLDDDTCRTTELWLRRIPAGTFIMGSPEDEVGRQNDETQHQVTLTQDYYIGVFECTQKQWELVMGSIPMYNSLGDCRPVEQVSYDMIRGSGEPAYGHTVNASSFMGKLQEKTGLVFDLPTEAEWEYACRAGTTTALNSGKNLINDRVDASLDEVGRYGGNIGDGKGGYFGVTKVGSYLSNAWGLYDMHGNVFELCLDWYGAYGAEAVDDPQGQTVGNERVLRGGGVYAVSEGGQSVGWGFSYECRSTYRHPTLKRRGEFGFRVALLP